MQNFYVNDFRLQIKVNDIDNPILQISFIDNYTLKGSAEYREQVRLCEEIMGMLSYIKNNSGVKPKETVTGRTEGEKARAIYAFSVADEILKFHELAKAGIITQDEFETQKQKLLSLEY